MKQNDHKIPIYYRSRMERPHELNTDGERRRAGKLPGGELPSHLVLPAKFPSPPVLDTCFCCYRIHTTTSADSDCLSRSIVLVDIMTDPFEVRMRFTTQLQHLSASVSSSQKVAQYALKYRDMDEDLHSCILEQLERVSKFFHSRFLFE